MEFCSNCNNESFSLVHGKCLSCGAIGLTARATRTGTDRAGDYWINPETGERIYS